jgi:hypothetical protein
MPSLVHHGCTVFSVCLSCYDNGITVQTQQQQQLHKTSRNECSSGNSCVFIREISLATQGSSAVSTDMRTTATYTAQPSKTCDSTIVYVACFTCSAICSSTNSTLQHICTAAASTVICSGIYMRRCRSCCWMCRTVYSLMQHCSFSLCLRLLMNCCYLLSSSSAM